MRRTSGFTLIELLLVVMIIGILFSIAIPLYSHYRVISLRGAAKAVLMELAARQDVYLAQNRVYAGTVADLGYAIPAEVDGVYTVTITLPVGSVSPDFNMPGYLIKADPQPGKSQEADGYLSINQFGLRMPIGKW